MSKVAIVTGASSGIGQAIANILSSEYTVYSLSRSEPNIPNVKHIKCDISDKDNVIQAISQVVKNEGRLDAIVNNAGMGISGPVELEKLENIEKIVSVNLVGTVNCCVVALPYLRETKGRIINIGSIGGECCLPFQAMYTATKTAVQSFSLALNNEMRPLGVKVICLLPGDVKTSFTKNRVKSDTTEPLYGERVERSISRMERDEQNGMSPDRIAKKIAKLLKAKHPPLTATVGIQYKLVRFVRRIVPEKLLNRVIYTLYGK